MLDGQDTTGIGYMALWGLGANCRVMGDGWMDGWMDTPQTVTTTRAPAVLKIVCLLVFKTDSLSPCNNDQHSSQVSQVTCQTR